MPWKPGTPFRPKKGDVKRAAIDVECVKAAFEDNWDDMTDDLVKQFKAASEDDQAGLKEYFNNLHKPKTGDQYANTLKFIENIFEEEESDEFINQWESLTVD